MLGLIYSVGSYLAFLIVYAYLVCFSDGALVPKHVDSAPAVAWSQALPVNLALLLLFGVQHSLMARPGFKRWLTQVVPVGLERATYVLASSAALTLLAWQWRSAGGVVWHVDSPAWRATLWSLNALGWLGVPLSSFMIDHFELFGIKPALNGFRRRTAARGGFVTPLFYKYVRHPMMTSLLVALWVTPHMTSSHLLLSVGMSLYIAIGVHFEERALLQELGRSYAEYQATTPQFLPLPKRKAVITRSPSS